MQAIIEGNLYEIEPAVKVILDRVMIENNELKRENKRLLDKIQSFYKNEKLDLIDRERFLRELNDKIDENAECRMAVTADELLEFIEEFEPVTEGELVARLSELEEENARLEEAYQKATGVIAMDSLPTAIDLYKLKKMCVEKQGCRECTFRRENFEGFDRCAFEGLPMDWNFGGVENETD